MRKITKQGSEYFEVRVRESVSVFQKKAAACYIDFTYHYSFFEIKFFSFKVSSYFLA